MNPKVMVILGVGGLMCLLFIIVGIVIWVNGDDDDDSTNNDSDSTTSNNSGNNNSNNNNNDTNANNSDANNSGANNSSNNSTPSGTKVSCTLGQKKINGVCYPICNGGEITGSCDARLPSGQHLDENREPNCSRRFFKDNTSPTGYSQCMWDDASTDSWYERGGASKPGACVTGTTPQKACIPEVVEGNENHHCASGVTWQRAGTMHHCECPEGTKKQEHNDDGRWRCR